MIVVDIPVVPDPDVARAAAHSELTKPAYHAHDPTLFQRLATRLVDWVQGAFDRASGPTPGNRLAILLLIGLVALVLIGIRTRLGPLRKAYRRSAPVFHSELRSAADHHAAADAALAAGDLSAATVERFRALVRGCEERGLLVPRPGRTANEVAAEVAGLRPSAAGPVHAAAGVFDEIRYGGRVGDRAGHDVVAAADVTVRGARASEPVLR
ncbi:MAG TPA: DUF4129 domain-containing protein [Sporichthyaceae bacterium]|jgi:hypothetical protein